MDFPHATSISCEVSILWPILTERDTRKMVDTSASFGERLIEREHDGTHSHGPAGEHVHAGTAFTTWLDFDLATAQARAVHEALVRLRPRREAVFDANLEELESDLRRLDEQMAAIAQRIGAEPLVASHPVYQYWARRYGLDVESVTWEPEVVPDGRATADLTRLLVEHPASLMIWEGEPDPRSVERLETLGLRSIVVDPCGNVPDEGDFLTVMERNIEALRAAVCTAPRRATPRRRSGLPR